MVTRARLYLTPHLTLALVMLVCAALTLAGSWGTAPTPRAAKPGSLGSGIGVRLVAEAPSPMPFVTAAEYARASELVHAMTPAQRAGQVIVATYAGTGSPTAMIDRLHLGGAVPVRDNIRSARQIGAVARSIQAHVGRRGYPAFVGIDQEGGRVTRIGKAPSFMAAGAAHDPALTRALARAMGQEMRALGFTVMLAPVADVTSGPGDPTIGTRSAGSRPGQVAGQVLASAQGLTEAGMIPVLKHFPGHGSVGVDTHVKVAVQRRSLARLRAVDLVPFARATRAGVPAVMTGHIDVRAVDPGRPATFSRKVTTGLLRHQLGFRGLVVTDSLGMGAITRRADSAEAAVRSLLAGADVVLMPPHPARARRGILAAVASGRLPQARVDEAATRMIATLLHQQRVRPAGARLGTSTRAQARASVAALTQVSGRCRGRLVGKSVEVVGPGARSFARIARSLGLRTGAGALVVLADGTRPLPPAAVVVATDRPYLLGRAKAKVRLASYGSSPIAFRAVVLRLLGKTTAPGRLPVRVKGVVRPGC